MGRKSTFANAFASALAPYDTYDQGIINKAIKDLDQDPDEELQCVYCGAEAATWDHVYNRVVKGEFSGHGHHIRNLVPCCRTCNESKGQKSWRDFLETRDLPDKELRVQRIEKFLSDANAQPIGIDDMRRKAGPELEKFLEVRSQIFDLMKEADRLAAIIREKVTQL